MEPLDVRHAVLERHVLSLHSLRKGSMLSLVCLEFLSMLVGRVAELLLQILDTLSHGCMVLLQGTRMLGRQITMELLDFRHAVLECKVLRLHSLCKGSVLSLVRLEFLSMLVG